MAIVAGRFLGRFTGGSPELLSSPRVGIDLPRMKSVPTITRNGTASRRPCLAHSGHHDLVDERNCSSDWATPRARAPASAAVIDRSRAISAAASAGTTSSVRFCGVSTPTPGPAKRRSPAVRTVESTHVTMPSRCGESRANDAARSFSAAAWIARPVRDRRNQTATARPTATVMAINQSRSVGSGASATVTVPVGRIGSSGRAVVPYFIATPACSVSMMPTAATTLASTGALRSGLDTRTSTSAPSAAAAKRAMTTHSHVGGEPTSIDGTQGSGRVNRPWRRSL